MEPQRASKPPAQELVGQSPPSPTREVDACQRPRGRGHGTLGFWGLTRPASGKLVAGPGPDSLATERGRSVRESTRADPASEALPVAPRAELASAAGGDGCPRCVAWSWIGRLEPRTAVPRVAADLAGKLSAPPGIGRRAGGRMCPDRRRVELLRPSAAGCQATPESDMGAQRPKSRVGAAGLGPAKPERGKGWKPSWGFQFNVRRAG